MSLPQAGGGGVGKAWDADPRAVASEAPMPRPWDWRGTIGRDAVEPGNPFDLATCQGRLSQTRCSSIYR